MAITLPGSVTSAVSGAKIITKASQKVMEGPASVSTIPPYPNYFEPVQ